MATTIQLKLIEKSNDAQIKYSLETNLKVETSEDYDFVMKIASTDFKKLEDGTYLIHINNLKDNITFNGKFNVDKNKFIKFMFKSSTSLSISQKIKEFEMFTNTIIDKIFYADDINEKNFNGNSIYYYKDKSSNTSQQPAPLLSNYNVVFIKSQNKVKVTTEVTKENVCADFDSILSSNSNWKEWSLL